VAWLPRRLEQRLASPALAVVVLPIPVQLSVVRWCLWIWHPWPTLTPRQQPVLLEPLVPKRAPLPALPQVGPELAWLGQRPARRGPLGLGERRAKVWLEQMSLAGDSRPRALGRRLASGLLSPAEPLAWAPGLPDSLPPLRASLGLPASPLGQASSPELEPRAASGRWWLVEEPLRPAPPPLIID
jgi:hypothetical protein